ncbi:hypothetical protein [Rhodoferax ferrireducens]|uniref:hypothetical protein n=1 Tax=Rhodoferax ferrireducens TaxID=192843 RepID=UPI000E0D35D6|nr:hypothetical protein [Rhodoferax ferrireducens]
MALTPPPTAPTTADPTTFAARADARIAWESVNVAELEAFQAALTSIAAGTAFAIPYTFSTTTTDADPGAGYLRLDNATQNLATTIRADLAGADGSTWTDVLNLIDDSTSAIKGFVMLQKLGDATKWLLFSVSALALPSGYKNIMVAVVASSAASPFANGDSLIFKFTRNGDKGDAGAAATLPIVAAGGTVDAITADFSPNLTLTDKTLCFVVCAGANTLTNPTFAPDGLTAQTITARGGAALNVGDIPAGGFVAIFEYNLAGTCWELLNPSASSAGDHRIILATGNGFGSTNTKIRRFTTTVTSTGTAISYADSAANGATFTINAAGLYAITSVEESAGDNPFGISANSAELTTNIQSATTVSRLIASTTRASSIPSAVSVTARLAVNDVIRAHSNGNLTNGNTCRFSIVKVGS